MLLSKNVGVSSVYLTNNFPRKGAILYACYNFGCSCYYFLMYEDCRKTLMTLPLCNQNPETAPRIGKHVFFLCWRCTGCLIGAFTAYFSILHNMLSFTLHTYFVLIFLCIPCIIDGYFQYYLLKRSNNIRRFFTGFLCGASLRLLLYAIANV